MIPRSFLRPLRGVVAAFALAGSLAFAPPAAAQSTPLAFVEQENGKLTALLRQPATPSRDTSITQVLDHMVDYDELARRTFGRPCPPPINQCQNHWDELSAPQQREVTDLLRKLVEKNYRKNLSKTLDYDVSYRGSRPLPSGETRVRTEAKSRTKPREAPVTVDYVVTVTPAGLKIVNIITEGSSLNKNYYEQFHRMLTTPGQGYPHVVQRLKDKIAGRK